MWQHAYDEYVYNLVNSLIKQLFFSVASIFSIVIIISSNDRVPAAEGALSIV